MKFKDLSESAKQRAIEWWSEGAASDFDGAQSYEDMATGLKFLGITVSESASAWQRSGGKIQHGPIQPEFEWSGFGSQGDGLVFTGRWKAEDMDLAGLVKDRGDKSPLLAIGQQLMIILLKYPRARAAIVTHRHGAGLPAIHVEEVYATPDDDDPLPGGDQEELGEAFKSAAHVCWRQLEAEYDHVTSKESAIESIEANDYDFDEEGESV